MDETQKALEFILSEGTENEAIAVAQMKYNLHKFAAFILEKDPPVNVLYDAIVEFCLMTTRSVATIKFRWACYKMGMSEEEADRLQLQLDREVSKEIIEFSKSGVHPTETKYELAHHVLGESHVTRDDMDKWIFGKGPYSAWLKENRY